MRAVVILDYKLCMLHHKWDRPKLNIDNAKYIPAKYISNATENYVSMFCARMTFLHYF